ncbi:alpha/beta hydrolase [Streptomyces sp. NPDC004111]|uniref:alpha/beta hydrolase n=1 Tax=Streptomyces sp. NPDC004111 TaxID=3364690 RepID=UPI00367DD18C
MTPPRPSSGTPAGTPRAPRRGRLRRTLLAALVAASVAVPVAGAAGATEVPAPAPAVLAPLDSPTAGELAGRYAARRADIRAAARAADDTGAHRRAASLRRLADPARQFLSFDGREGGRTVEVFGDLARAGRTAVLVPGADTSVDSYDRLRDGARALLDELGEGAAVVAWVGYRTPATVSTDAVTPDRADTGAAELIDFTAELARIRPSAKVSLLCHSYGSVVCARAAYGLRADNLVVYGSPGTGVAHADALGTRATVWAGRGSADWIGGVPHVSLELPLLTIGFGEDPMNPAYGARHFDAGDSDHSGYLKPGSRSLRNLAHIVAGTTGTTGTGADRPGSGAGPVRAAAHEDVRTPGHA